MNTSWLSFLWNVVKQWLAFRWARAAEQKAEAEAKRQKEVAEREAAERKIAKDIRNVKPVELDSSADADDPLGIDNWNRQRGSRK